MSRPIHTGDNDVSWFFPTNPRPVRPVAGKDHENPARDAGNAGWGIWPIHPFDGDVEVQAVSGGEDGLSDALSIRTIGTQRRMISTTSFKRMRDIVPR